MSADVETSESLHTAGWNVNWYTSLGNGLSVSKNEALNTGLLYGPAMSSEVHIQEKQKITVLVKFSLPSISPFTQNMSLLTLLVTKLCMYFFPKLRNSLWHQLGVL